MDGPSAPSRRDECGPPLSTAAAPIGPCTWHHPAKPGEIPPREEVRGTGQTRALPVKSDPKNLVLKISLSSI